MFEVAELGRKVSKEAFAQAEPALREALLELQGRLKGSRDFSYVIVMSGVEAAGKGAAANLLLEWLDARELDTLTLGDPAPDDLGRPALYRFWRQLPPRGRGALLLGSWYTEPIIQRALGELDDAGFERALQRIIQFERMLALERVVLVKCWLHLSKDAQRARLEAMAEDPDESWRLSERDWRFHAHYDDFRAVCEEVLRRTSTGLAPWHLIEATQPRYRDLTLAQTLQKTLAQHLEHTPADSPRAHLLDPPEEINILRHIDLTKRVEAEAYEARLESLQADLARLARALHKARRSLVVVFEGMDAAGKGGAIRRVTQALDARFYQVVSIAAPSEEERRRPYLWRFWHRIPRPGQVTIFDRSWYGRVLVERIEGFCAVEDWRRAFVEINHFEEELAASGAVVVKFWLQISDEEQERRFQDREETGHKRHKLTAEDWRNREKLPLYERAACEMIERTSSRFAPWTLVEAEQKQFSRLKVLETLCDALRRALGVDPEALRAEDVRQWKKERKKGLKKRAQGGGEG
jgi:polyphosphate:AMP phosphotransferase